MTRLSRVDSVKPKEWFKYTYKLTNVKVLNCITIFIGCSLTKPNLIISKTSLGLDWESIRSSPRDGLNFFGQVVGTILKLSYFLNFSGDPSFKLKD